MIIIINWGIDFLNKTDYYILENDNQSQIKGAIRMPLALVTLGETKTITDFRGKDDMRRHLQDLGFIKGEKVEVIGENPSGLILLVKGVRIALNKGLASKIMVD